MFISLSGKNNKLIKVRGIPGEPSYTGVEARGFLTFLLYIKFRGFNFREPLTTRKKGY